MAKISVLGVDLGKNVCSVVGLDASGAVVMRRRMRRETLIGLAETLPACVVGMEACCGSHHLGRVFASHGHDVRLRQCQTKCLAEPPAVVGLSRATRSDILTARQRSSTWS
jgi:hypothetical protein